MKEDRVAVSDVLISPQESPCRVGNQGGIWVQMLVEQIKPAQIRVQIVPQITYAGSVFTIEAPFPRVQDHAGDQLGELFKFGIPREMCHNFLPRQKPVNH